LHGFFNALRVELALLEKNVPITLCAIGATDTEGAKKVKELMPSDVDWASASSAAASILRGAAKKKREIFHPHHLVFPATFIYNIFPSFIDHTLLSIAKNSKETNDLM
jgi:short-subunit dehydrogenase